VEFSVFTDEELAQGGWRFEDLQELRIVKNRTDLNRKQRKLGFPKPVKTGESQALFLKVEVCAWLRGRAALRDAPTPEIGHRAPTISTSTFNGAPKPAPKQKPTAPRKHARAGIKAGDG